MRARKTDSTQAEIVAGLRAAGVLVWIIEEPCDLLWFDRGRWGTMECKPKGWKPRKDQPAQNAFLKATGTPVARSAEEAFRHIRPPESFCSKTYPDGPTIKITTTELLGTAEKSYECEVLPC